MTATEAGPEEPVDPLLGRTLEGRYRVLRRLGAGGMGAVYEGEHLGIKKRVAIKVLHPQWAMTGEAVLRFKREALAATAIGHEHIVEVNDIGKTPEGAPFMVLELLAGRDLASLLEAETALTAARAVRILSQVCDALVAAHDKGIVHRDLKPENIFLVRKTSDPEFVKVLDFGISKMADAEGDAAARATTKTGVVMGTAYYMSPEQAQGKRDVDHRADVWAMGVILFRVLTGRYPFDDEAFPMLIVKICAGDTPSLRDFRDDLPAELDAVVARCLLKEPHARFGSCRELRDALTPFAALDRAPHLVQAAAATGKASTPLAFEKTALPKDATTPEAVATSGAHSTPLRGATIPDDVTRPMASAPPPHTSRNAMAVALIAALALAGLGAWAVAGSSPDAAVPEVPGVPPVVAVPDPAPVPEPPPVVTVPSGEIERIHVHVETTPAEALLFIDDRPVANPYDAERRVDDVVHTLRAERTGYRTYLQDLWLADPQTIRITLHRGTGTEDTRAVRAEVTAVPPPHGPEVAPPPEHTATVAVTEEPVAPPPTDEVVPNPSGSVMESGAVVPPPPHALKTVRVP